MEEAQLLLADLQKALHAEQQHRYVNVQGRQKTFSKFVEQQLRAWKKLPVRKTEHEGIETWLPKFQRYAFMDMPARMAMHEHFTDWLNGIQKSRLAETQSLTGAASQVSAKTQKNLQGEVQFLKGVGPKMAALLNQLGVHTILDLLYHFPRRYLDYQQRVKINELKVDDEVTILAWVRSVNVRPTKNKHLLLTQIRLGDETGTAFVTSFVALPKNKKNQAASTAMATAMQTKAQFQERYPKGTQVMVSGKVKWDSYSNRPMFDRPQVEILSYDQVENGKPVNQETDIPLHAGRIVPVYPLTEGLNLRFLRKAIYQALQEFLPTIEDPLPEDLKKKYNLIPLQEALEQIHFPDSLEAAEHAKHRLVFDELFYFQARLAKIRQEYKLTVKGLQLQRKKNDQPEAYVDQFIHSLPFKLTQAQLRVFREICKDLSTTEPMYRLLHGDVGSGKTVVAALALLVGVENGYQGALMAPTEILAEQHYRKFIQWLTPLGLKVGLFVGKAGTKAKRQLRQDLLNGQIHIAIGTHALIQEGVEFQKLGVVVVDEQHRFGVRQRTLLKAKGESPELLTMTATPIPRTLAMTLHGDLDVSMLDELPPGRSPIQTHLLMGAKQKEAYTLIRYEVQMGRQVYIVFPLIDESESLSAKAATAEAARLKKEVFPDLRIGLLHGKMKPEEKDKIMGEFSRHELDILVATTVVEVGVDVPNATVMVVENAERFGLAQLHQLRGRVGRGAHQSYCLLMAHNPGDDTRRRLEIMTETTNGFVIAEKDLQIRGPGEFLGTRQSGLPDFVLADLIQDQAILEAAREAAFKVINDPAFLERYPNLAAVIDKKAEDAMQVLGAG